MHRPVDPAQQAEKLAKHLDELLHLDWLDTQRATILEITAARQALHEYREQQQTRLFNAQDEWLDAPHTCEQLGVTIRTLKRWRDDGRITPGIHWRRTGPNNRSHCVYNCAELARHMARWAQ